MIAVLVWVAVLHLTWALYGLSRRLCAFGLTQSRPWGRSVTSRFRPSPDGCSFVSKRGRQRPSSHLPERLSYVSCQGPSLPPPFLMSLSMFSPLSAAMAGKRNAISRNRGGFFRTDRKPFISSALTSREKLIFRRDRWTERRGNAPILRPFFRSGSGPGSRVLPGLGHLFRVRGD